MKKPSIIINIIKEEIGYSASASIQNRFIGTEGDDFDELKTNILEAVNLSFQDLGFVYTIDEIVLKPDIQSFFDFYKVINVKALSERIGMNQSLLAQYISGIKKPSANQTKRILQGVQQVGKELTAIQFLMS
ncbi:XRE family transcriptional regulator [Dyadobacter psychrotolerans]|uniref:XRE family transcriptional regulator n=1 Tax=Dyadobacter psychrotolerans TaxID=2541721 RepID=A0A4R5DS69_9BACT|nr:XRE family transcriptional regulator [Dyadobacter psychrotolerans]TDE13683.1 XRE family transcriptional regulator [Dyadobacter psychrotolerans]